jgi:hypothetical protein
VQNLVSRPSGLTVRIIEFLDFVHRPMLKQRFGNWICLHLQVLGRGHSQDEFPKRRVWILDDWQVQNLNNNNFCIGLPLSDPYRIQDTGRLSTGCRGECLKLQETGDNCITRSSVIRMPGVTFYNYGDEVKHNVCSTHGRDEKCVQNFSQKMLRKKDDLRAGCGWKGDINTDLDRKRPSETSCVHLAPYGA